MAHRFRWYGSGELAWTAPANNPQNWNQLFNFWFDSNLAPVAGNATIDQARIGAGALNFTVPTTVPGLQPAMDLGVGCGTPAANMSINGVPSAGNAAFALNISSAPATDILLYFADVAANSPLGSGCTLYLDLASFGAVGFYTTDGSGNVSVPIPVGPGQTPADLIFQAATFIPSPPLFGLIGLSNGLRVRFAGTGCY